VPGVVIGLVLLVALGLLRPTRAVVRAAEPAAVPVLAHLQLLFVPPGAAIVLQMRSLAQNPLPLALAVGGSIVLTLLLAGWLLRRPGRWPRDLGRWPRDLGRWPRGPGRWLAGPSARAVMTRTGLPSTRDRRRHECDHRAARLRAGPDPVGLPAVRAAVPASGA